MIQVSKQSCPIPFTAIVTHHQRQRDSNCRTSNYQPKPFCALAEFFLGEQGYRISRLTTGWPRDPRTATTRAAARASRPDVVACTPR
jgi:hypothetical protein